MSLAAAGAAQRPARFLRIVKVVSQPNDDLLDIDNTAFGVSTAQGMREILGYVPIEPDGSVMVKVGAAVYRIDTPSLPEDKAYAIPNRPPHCVSA